MAWWTDRILPRFIDRVLATGDVMKEREKVCAGLRGRVLEIGFGSGLNIEKYPDTIESITAVEPSDLAWKLSADRRESTQIPIHRTGLDGQALAESDESFDTVLSTFTLCTIPDVRLALREIRRVLKPEGSLIVLEHGLAPDEGVARWQKRLDPVEKFVAGGCHLSRDIPELLQETGFREIELDQRYLPGPKIGRPWTYCYSGTASPQTFHA